MRIRYLAAAIVLLAAPAFAQSAEENDAINAYWNAWWSNDVLATVGHLATLETVNPTSAFLAERRGFQALIYQGDPAAAVTLYAEALMREPDNDEEVQIYYGRALLAAGEVAAAIETLQATAENNPRNGDAAYHLARAQLIAENRTNAIATLMDLRENVTLHLDANRLLHRLLVEDGRYAEALAIWRAENAFTSGGQEEDAVAALDARYAAISGEMSRVERAQLFWDMRFLDEALFELNADPADTDIGFRNRIATFMDFQQTFASELNAFYRERIWANEELDETFWVRLRPVFEGFDVDAQTIEFAEDADDHTYVQQAIETIEDAFPVEMTCGQTGIFINCHVGYEVYRTTYAIEQWGIAAEIDSQVLKWMVSNGLSAWAWDYRAQAGGWTTSSGQDMSTFINIIDPKFSAAPYRVQTYLYGDELDLDAMRAQALEDIADGPAYSRSLSQMFRHRDMTYLFDQAADLSPANAEAFVINRLLNHIHVTQTARHEIKHFTDQHEEGGDEWEVWELEFRGKLTELAYGELAFMTLQSLYSPSFGVMDQPHPRASTLVLQDLLFEMAQDPELAAQSALGLVGLLDLDRDTLRDMARRIYVRHYGAVPADQ